MLYRKHNTLAFFAFLLVLSLSGCSTYQNVTSYFNTYYNAQKLFDDAIIEMERANRPDKDTIYFAQPTSSSGGQSKFDKVIEKCSKLIQYYPESNLVDDAILLIGKSGVYIGESELAIRKFAELFQNFPESDLLFEAKLWNAKALYFSNKQEEALKIINEVYPLAVQEGENNVAIEAQMLAAQMYFKRQEYIPVVEHLEKAVELSGDDNLLRVAYYQLAISLERLGDYEHAAIAYRKVMDYYPDLSLAFRTRMKSGIMLYRSNQTDEALDVFQSLNAELLKPEEQALVDHEVANVYAALDDSVRAFDMYEYVDTTYKRTDAAARSLYRKGVLMEERYGNFKKAAEYYSKARTEFAGSDIVPDAVKRSNYLAKYFAVRSEIRSCDSLYFYMLNEDSLKDAEEKKAKLALVADSVKRAQRKFTADSIRAARRDSLLASGADSATVAQQIVSSEAMEESAAGREEGEGSKVIAKNEEGESGQAKVTENGEAGSEEGGAQKELGAQHNEGEQSEGKPSQEQDGEKAMTRSISTDPTQTNTPPPPQIEQPPVQRRQQFVQEFGTIEQQRARHRDDEEEMMEEQRISGAVTADATGIHQPAGEGRSRPGNSPDKPVAGTVAVAPIATGMTFDSLYNLQTRKYYELGSLFMTEMGLSDSAEYIFEKVINEFPGSVYTPRVIYTLAEFYNEREDSCKADSLYRKIFSEYQNSEYARHLKKYFGMKEDTVRIIDSVQVRYSAINVFPDTLHALESIGQLEKFREEYPASPLAIKALYAMGWIYENILVNNDSAASVYKMLVDNYPQSEYAAVAKPKVAVKENPENLSQYIRVKEIQAIAKPVKQERGKGDVKDNEGQEGSDDSFQDRFRNRNADGTEEDEQLQDENSDENTDENNEDQENQDEGNDDSGGDPDPSQFQW